MKKSKLPEIPGVASSKSIGTYTWDHQVISLDKLEKVLNRMTDLDPEKNMIVLPSGGRAHRDLVTVLDLMNKSGLVNISLISTE